MRSYCSGTGRKVLDNSAVVQYRVSFPCAFHASTGTLCVCVSYCLNCADVACLLCSHEHATVVVSESAWESIRKGRNCLMKKLNEGMTRCACFPLLSSCHVFMSCCSVLSCVLLCLRHYILTRGHVTGQAFYGVTTGVGSLLNEKTVENTAADTEIEDKYVSSNTDNQ